jgi:hypothetical protein
MGKKLILGKSMSNTIFHYGYNKILRSTDELTVISVSSTLYDMLDYSIYDSVSRLVDNSKVRI